MRFGLLGYGAWGRHHAAAIAGCVGTELVAIACKSEESRRQAQADLFQNPHPILEDPAATEFGARVPGLFQQKGAADQLRRPMGQVQRR